MGYYATLEDWDIENAVISNVEEFEKERAKECEYGFAPDNLEIEYGENGKIKSFEFQEIDIKWYDQEEFSNLLAKYLVEGCVQFWFIGEDMEKWTWTVFPGFVLDGDWLEFDADTLHSKIADAPNNVKLMILEKYLSYWSSVLKKAEQNLKKAKESV